MRYALCLLFVLALPLSTVQAGTTIREFVPSCESTVRNLEDPFGDACLWYMAGVASVFTSHVLKWPVCSPEGTTTMDVIDAFLDWAHRNPGVWDEDVFRGVLAALSDRYGC